jgi:choline dehydrogenase-like flavoprotein
MASSTFSLQGGPADQRLWDLQLDDATRLLGYSPADFDPEVRLRPSAISAAREASSVETAVFVVDDDAAKPYPVRFANEISCARDLRLALHAVVTRVALDQSGGHVDHLDVATENGHRWRATASAYVLACHAVENARLLLDSDDVLHEGVGNRSGFVGRCFMDHPHVDAGLVHFPRNAPLHLVQPLALRSGYAACLAPTQAVTDRASCLQYFARLLPVGYDPDTEQAITTIATAWRHPRAPRFWRALATAASHPSRSSRATARHLGVRPREFVLNQRIEQAPNPSSRVVLLDERDPLGRRRAGIDWQLDDTDARTLAVGQEAVLRELQRIGATRMRAAPADTDFLATRGSSYWHHIGTTRMSETADTGVVDRNCRVHGVDNLFVAGSAVFCRATFSPPTMTITAFALRLADHLSRLAFRNP